MNRLQSLPFGALLLLTTLPYHSWAVWAGTYPAWQAHRAALITVFVVVVFWAGLRLLGCAAAKASLITAIPAILFLFGELSLAVPIAVTAAAFLAAVIDKQRRYQNANLALAIAGIVLLVGAGTPLVSFTLHEPKVVAVEHGSELSVSIDNAEWLVTPSIIHIVLDGYGGSGPLADIYGHDTRPFFEQLTQRGFLVVDDAIAPYNQTLPSVASVFSGAPVQMSDYDGHPTALRQDLAYTVRYGPVSSILQAAGYRFARVESGYGFLDFEVAQCVNCDLARMTMLETHLLRRFGDYFVPVHNNILRAALVPGMLSELQQPFFYYQHLIAPHPPFSIAADGSDRPAMSSSYKDGNHLVWGLQDRRDAYIAGYDAKASFIESALIRQIDSFPSGPKIVIIHGDHGPGAYFDHESAGQTCFSERMRTFVALYSDVPEVRERLQLRPAGSFSIVNIYRAVLSGLSGAEIPFVPTEARYVRWSDPSEVTLVSPADLDRPCEIIEPQ